VKRTSADLRSGLRPVRPRFGFAVRQKDFIGRRFEMKKIDGGSSKSVGHLVEKGTQEVFTQPDDGNR
jgi:hypothetical protein